MHSSAPQDAFGTKTRERKSKKVKTGSALRASELVTWQPV